MERKTGAEINRRLAALAVEGTFTVEAAEKGRVDQRSVQRRAANGQLTRLSRGNYAIAGAPKNLPMLQRAALAATGSSGLAIWSASHAHGCVATQPKLVHVAVEPHRRLKKTDWYRAHRLRELEDDEVVELWDIPVTTMARAIRDHAAVLVRAEWADLQLRRLTAEALTLGKVDLEGLVQQYDRERGRALRKRLDEIVAYESGRDTANLKSEGEKWLRDLVIARG